MSVADFAIIGVVLAAAVLAIIFYLRRKKSGKGCGFGCAGCAGKDACGQAKNGQGKRGKTNK